MGALEGIQVIDFGLGMAAGLCTMIMADNGADVLKVEPPAGDPARRLPGFRQWHRGKQSVVVDLKTTRLTHADLGQLQLYVNYFDREERTPGDHPTLGLVLCTDKNDAVVKYTLGPNQQQIFTSRYQLHPPSEAELREELQRELKELRQP